MKHPQTKMDVLFGVGVGVGLPSGEGVGIWEEVMHRGEIELLGRLQLFPRKAFCFVI